MKIKFLLLILFLIIGNKINSSDYNMHKVTIAIVKPSFKTVIIERFFDNQKSTANFINNFNQLHTLRPGDPEPKPENLVIYKILQLINLTPTEQMLTGVKKRPYNIYLQKVQRIY